MIEKLPRIEPTDVLDGDQVILVDANLNIIDGIVRSTLEGFTIFAFGRSIVFAKWGDDDSLRMAAGIRIVGHTPQLFKSTGQASA